MLAAASVLATYTASFGLSFRRLTVLALLSKPPAFGALRFLLVGKATLLFPRTLGSTLGTTSLFFLLATCLFLLLLFPPALTALHILCATSLFGVLHC